MLWGKFLFFFYISYFKACSSSGGASAVKLLCELQVRSWRLISAPQCSDILTFGVTHSVDLLCVLSPWCCCALWSPFLLDICGEWRIRNALNYTSISWGFPVLLGWWVCQQYFCWSAIPCCNAGTGYRSLTERGLQAPVELCWHQDIQPFLVCRSLHPVVWQKDAACISLL